MPVTWYTLFKGVHVIAAVVWVGGAHFSAVLGARAARSGDGKRMADFAGEMEVLSLRMFVPSSFVLLLSGTAMMINGSLDWGQLWVDYGLAIWFVAFVLGIGFFGPESGRLKTLIRDQGPGSAEVQERIRRILVVSRIELVLLIGVVWAMTTKLATGNGGTAWVVASALGLLAALAFVGRGLAPRR
jgi:uncharacterized membrane protein